MHIMNAQLNDYFKVQSLVGQFKSAESMTSYPYERKVETTLIILSLLTCIFMLITAVNQNSNYLLILSIAVIIATALCIKFDNAFIPSLFIKGFTDIIWGYTITKKVIEIKRITRDELYDMKATINSMLKAEKEWREVAKDAKNINDWILR